MKWYIIHNLGKLLDKHWLKARDITEKYWFKESVTYRAKVWWRIAENTFIKFKELFWDEIEYEESEYRTWKHTWYTWTYLNTNIIIQKLKALRARKWIKTEDISRKEEIEREIEFENQKTERVRALYKSKWINLRYLKNQNA
jgi:uncharacterized protein YlbG (UPF0298 family)